MKKIRCDLCSSDDCEFLFEAVDRLFGCKGTFTYVRCRQCGLVYMNPQVSQQDIAQFYPANYKPHQTKTAPCVVSPRKLIKNCHISLLRDNLDRQKKLLDVGCGNGSFLYQIHQLTQCQVYGLDISEAAAEAARESYGLNIFTGTVFESPFEEGDFDIVTAWHYLEHVHNPSDVLKAISGLLKAGGQFIMNTPDFGTINSRLFRDKWYYLDCPRHLHLFNRKTIKVLMAKNGFDVVRIINRRSSKGLLGSLQYYFYGDNYKDMHHNRIRKSLPIKLTASFISRVTSLLGHGDVMIVVAEKV